MKDKDNPLLNRLASPLNPDWRQKCLDLGFQYWRAPDAHGVICTQAQAVEFMQEVLGVEVEIKEAPIPAAKSEPLPGCDCPKCGRGHLVEQIEWSGFFKCDHCGECIPF